MSENGRLVRLIHLPIAAADLLVVGSRGLHGVKALVSVSERVDHEAPCPALIVRLPSDLELPEPPTPRRREGTTR